jgi:hypothetical protein
MSQNKVIFKRIISPDGKSIAEAYSEVNVSDKSRRIIHQNVTVNVSSGSSSSSSSASSSASSR